MKRVKVKRRGKKGPMLIPRGTELTRGSSAREEVQELRARPVNPDPYQAGIQLLRLICRTQSDQGFVNLIYNHPNQTGPHPTPHCVFPKDPTTDLLQPREDYPPDLTLHIPTTHQTRTHSCHGPHPSRPPALGPNALRRALTGQRGRAMLRLRHRFLLAQGVNTLSAAQADSVPTGMQLLLPQNGARALRREVPSDGAYTACRATSASRAASTWNSRWHGGRKRRRAARRRRDGKKKTRGGSRWLRAGPSSGCRASRRERGGSTMRRWRRKPRRNAAMRRYGRGRRRCCGSTPRRPSGRSRWRSGRSRRSARSSRRDARNARHVARKRNSC
ncbi:hypothetical protein BJV78DRAFT_259980 [Lactifluus subvellereus]|nr:hypothetical protein BJV78DRAFT_259980 [Lactifluus subvellereus]